MTRRRSAGCAAPSRPRPIPPARWLAAHALATSTGLAVVVAGGYLGGLTAALTVDDLSPVDAGPLAAASLAGGLCFLAVGAVAALLPLVVLPSVKRRNSPTPACASGANASAWNGA
mgnify:CR=1 FL=1